MFAQHPRMAKEWAKKTPAMGKLPEKVKIPKRPRG